MDTLIQDLRYGMRVLFRKPGFAAVAVLTLAIGIGANTAIFSVVNGILLRPLPYKDAGRIVTLWQSNIQKGVERVDVSPANFIDWQEKNQVFDEMSVIEPYSFSLTGQGEPESIRSWLVSDGFFKVLGVEAMLGRTFLAEEYQPGNERVIVIGHGLWKRRFGSDPDLIGQKILLNGQPYIVAGIMPPEFQFPAGREIWAPKIFRERERQDRGSTYMKAIARLRPGTTIDRARDDLGRIAHDLAQSYPETNLGVGVTLIPLPEHLLGNVRTGLFVIFGAVCFVMLIACANVANLLLVRGAERQREFAIRAALGAARAQLVRQLLTESLVLALSGGVGGLLLASWGIDLILAFSPGNLPRIEQVGIDAGVLGFVFGICILTALIFGLVPSIQSSRSDLQELLKEGGRGATAGFARHRLRKTLVVSEIALALTLLVGAGLLIRSFVRLLQVDPGFSADRALTLEVHVWGRSRTPQQRAAFFDQTLERISALPGVQAAGAVSALPFHDNSIDIDTSFAIEGRPAMLPGQEPTAFITFATADYLTAMGIPLLRGRFYTRFDNQDAAPVLLISEAMARTHWPDEDPVGKKIVINYDQQPVAREIIGVVGDTRHTGLDSGSRPEIYLPHLQSPYGSMTYVVRTTGDPLSLLQAVKNEIWAVNKDQPFSSVSTVEQLVSKSLAERRFNLLLFGSFALIALALAGVGIYGLISFSTSQRTHEIGVRMALGANHKDVMRLVLREGLALTAMGLVTGWVAAFALTRVISSMLFGVSATDPLTFAAVSAVLAAVALTAGYIPARRATRVDPMIALRYE